MSDAGDAAPAPAPVVDAPTDAAPAKAVGPPPKRLPKPDDAAMKAACDELAATIAGNKRTIAQAKAALDARAEAKKAGGSPAVQAARAKLDALRDAFKAELAAKQAARAELDAANAAREKARSDARDARAKLPYTTPAAVDARMAELEVNVWEGGGEERERFGREAFFGSQDQWAAIARARTRSRPSPALLPVPLGRPRGGRRRPELGSGDAVERDGGGRCGAGGKLPDARLSIAHSHARASLWRLVPPVSAPGAAAACMSCRGGPRVLGRETRGERGAAGAHGATRQNDTHDPNTHPHSSPTPPTTLHTVQNAARVPHPQRRESVPGGAEEAARRAARGGRTRGHRGRRRHRRRRPGRPGGQAESG